MVETFNIAENLFADFTKILIPIIIVCIAIGIIYWIRSLRRGKTEIRVYRKP